MDDDLLREILGCPSLPSLPAVAARVLELTADNDVSMDELAETVVKDQAMAARVLQTVNSSFYGLRQRCGTIRKALVMLGLGPVKSIVLSFSLISAIEEGQYEDLDLESFWRRSLYTATAAKIALLQVGQKDASDEAFLGGLLQDVGVIAMHRTLGARYAEILRESGGSHRCLSRIETERLATSHAEIGAALGAHWRLPDELTLPIRFHEKPTASPARCAQIVRAVMLGNLVHDVMTDPEPAASLRSFYRRAEEWFAIPNGRADDLLGEVCDAVSELQDLFRLSIGARTSASEILDRAHEQLEAACGQCPEARAFADELDSMLLGEGPDPLTGLLSRSGVASLLRSGYHLGAAKGQSVSLVVLAVDRYSELCRNGPEGFDLEITLGVAVLLKEHFDPLGAAVAGLGSGVFAAVIVGEGRDRVIDAAERFRTALRDHSPHWDIPDYREDLVLTTSVGLVSTQGGERAFSSPEQMRAVGVRAAQRAQAAGGDTLRAFVPRGVAC